MKVARFNKKKKKNGEPPTQTAPMVTSVDLQ